MQVGMSQVSNIKEDVLETELFLSQDAVEFLRRLLTYIRLDPMDPEFKRDAKAIIEIKEVLLEQAENS